MERVYTQRHACHLSAIIDGRLPLSGDIPSSTNAGVDPEPRLQSKVGTRRTMALTKEQSLREAIAHEETQLAELADQYNETQERLSAHYRTRSR